VTPSIVQGGEFNARDEEADASVTLLHGNSHFVPFGERDQIVICLMR